jgi:cold shock CspA family protein
MGIPPLGRRTIVPAPFSRHVFEKEVSIMQTGTIIKWYAERAFGFIRRDDIERDIFFHINGLVEFNMDLITPGRRVRFEAVPGRGGREQAINVAVAE